jgi:hypothetical protein
VQAQLTFHEVLERSHLAKRELARLCAAHDGDRSAQNVERWRNRIYGWDTGRRIDPDSAATLAVVLGIDYDLLPVRHRDQHGRTIRDEVAELRAEIHALRGLLETLAETRKEGPQP